MSTKNEKFVVPFQDMTDQEIIQHCKNICKKHGSKDAAINEIKAWSGTQPAIIFNHHPSNKNMFQFMGMIFSPDGKTLKF